MGQIVIAGMYRQRGAERRRRWRRSARRGLLAELVMPAEGSPQLLSSGGRWTGIGRQTWKPVAVESVRLDEPPASIRTVQRRAQASVTIMLEGSATTLIFPSAEQQQMALRTLADWVVRPRLLKIPGVAEVFIQGGDRKQYQILVDPDGAAGIRRHAAAGRSRP